MTSPVIIVFCLVNRWNGAFDSEIPGNILYSLDLHIIQVLRKIQQIHVRSSGEGEVAVETLTGRTIVPSNRKLRFGPTRSLDQVRPIEGVATKREDNIRIKFLLNLRESFDQVIVRVFL